jgi:hypothetical protein
MQKSFAKLLTVIASIAASFSILGGTLEDAPFKISLPSNDWKLADSTAQDMGRDVFLLASITKTNSPVKSVIIKTKIDGPIASALDELSAGIRDSFANPAVKKLSDTESTFVGYKARRFIYEITQNNQTTYNEAVVFVAGKTGWTIAGLGPTDQKDEVKKIFTFYQKARTKIAN